MEGPLWPGEASVASLARFAQVGKNLLNCSAPLHLTAILGVISIGGEDRASFITCLLHRVRFRLADSGHFWIVCCFRS